MTIIYWIIIGSVAGWLGGKLMRGGGFGFLGNLIVGIVGAVLGGWVFGLLGISAGGWVGSLVTATAGAVILLFLIGLAKKA